jgi:molybdopterin-synthase adenylyltransferase
MNNADKSHTQNYEVLYDRNKIYITNELQKKIRNTTLLFGGCGLGSNIASLAVRTGFEKIIIADGDKVSVSNLNRQYFETSDIGNNKARALCAKLEKINPDSKISVIDKYITEKDLEELIDRADVIINTLDYSAAFVKLINISCEKGKTVIVPFNIGFGVVIVIFNNKSKSISEIIGSEGDFDSDLQLYEKLMNNLNYRLPDTVSSKLLEIFEHIKEKKYSPQLGVASSINSAIIVTIIMLIIEGKEIPLAPNVINLDLHQLIQNSV